MTTTTITDRQIQTISRDAAEAGDMGQVALCEIALYGEAGVDDARPSYRVEAQMYWCDHGVTQDVARARLARHLADMAAEYATHDDVGNRL